MTIAAEDRDPKLNGPLAGVRVIEMGQLLAGPFTTSRLADFGAEVIKVETPGKGDPMREWGHHRWEGKCLWWSTLARNKKSVTANLREERGQDLVKKLVAEGRVKEKPDRQDKRSTVLILTPKGNDLYQRIKQESDAREKKFLASLTAAERKALPNILTKLDGVIEDLLHELGEA